MVKRRRPAPRKKKHECHQCSHKHSLRCITTKNGKVVCGDAAKKMTRKQKTCAGEKFVPAMVREWKRGRWKSREQAIAVGLSKARREC